MVQMFECQMVGCSTLVDRQQRTHGHRWSNGELKTRQDQQMTQRHDEKRGEIEMF